MMFFPFPLPSTKRFTLSVLRLYTDTENPLLSIFITRFSPITARPMRPISLLCIPSLLNFQRHEFDCFIKNHGFLIDFPINTVILRIGLNDFMGFYGRLWSLHRGSFLIQFSIKTACLQQFLMSTHLLYTF